MSIENKAVFEDTKRRYETDSFLKKHIKDSIAQQSVEKGTVKLMVSAPHDSTNLVVSNKRSFEAAKSYANQGKKVCVLNFASATNPGGGVLKGSSAQEESLCRISTLYPCIAMAMLDFYEFHRKAIWQGTMDASYNDDCIYTPEVVVFKSDTSTPKVIPDRYTVDVITCAAPNLRPNPTNQYNPYSGNKPLVLKDSELLKIHMDRGRKILTLAANNGCDAVILGAFGCGAFSNSPTVVAEAYRRLLREWAGMFSTIEFAVYCPPRSNANYVIFNRVLTGGSGSKVLM